MFALGRSAAMRKGVNGDEAKETEVKFSV